MTSRKSGVPSRYGSKRKPSRQKRNPKHVPRLHVVALSGRLPDWAERACAEYAKRMPRGYEVERSAVKRLALPRHSHVIALDERGKDLTTRQFTGLLQRETVFVIGGPDGLDEKI